MIRDLGFLPTAREGNVFRSVCLFTGGLPTEGVYIQRKGLPTEGGLQRGSTYRGVCLQREGLPTEGGSAYRWRVCLQRGFDYRGGSANRGGSAYRGVGPTSLRLTSSGCHCSGWYASYWNASLLTCVIVFTDNQEQLHKPRIRQPCLEVSSEVQDILARIDDQELVFLL